MHDCNSELFGFLNIVEPADTPVINDIPCILSKRNGPCKYIHQRRFSGAVFAYKRVDLSAFHFEIDMIQSFDTRILFDDVFHFKNYVCQVNTSCAICFFSKKEAAARCSMRQPLIHFVLSSLSVNPFDYPTGCRYPLSSFV